MDQIGDRPGRFRDESIAFSDAVSPGHDYTRCRQGVPWCERLAR
jgi:hypothetical protein